MTTDLKSHLSEIEDLDRREWSGIQRKILDPVRDIRKLAQELGEEPVNARLVSALEAIENHLYRLDCVSSAINRELNEVSAGIDGLVRMLSRLDDTEISAVELCGLTKPLALMLGNVCCHHHELNS